MRALGRCTGAKERGSRLNRAQCRKEQGSLQIVLRQDLSEEVSLIAMATQARTNTGKGGENGSDTTRNEERRTKSCAAERRIQERWREREEELQEARSQVSDGFALSHYHVLQWSGWDVRQSHSRRCCSWLSLRKAPSDERAMRWKHQSGQLIPISLFHSHRV